ncbi:MAG: hypothetical protein E3K32_12150 [wastewater metagenome]|nr:hypothetical protein [Candidatus Loosdrechtia aerotolerans]
MKRRDSSLPRFFASLRTTNFLLKPHPEWNEGFQDGNPYSVALSGAKCLIPDAYVVTGRGFCLVSRSNALRWNVLSDALRPAFDRSSAYARPR